MSAAAIPAHPPAPPSPSLAAAWRAVDRLPVLRWVALLGAPTLLASIAWDPATGVQSAAPLWLSLLLVATLALMGAATWLPMSPRALAAAFLATITLVALRNSVYTAGVVLGPYLLVLQLACAGTFAVLAAPTLSTSVAAAGLLVTVPLVYWAAVDRTLLTPNSALALAVVGPGLLALTWRVAWWHAVAQRAHAAALHRADADGLTGVLKRRSFFEKLDALAPDRAVGVVSLDVDLFKHLNDEYGHLTGDRVLSELGELLRTSAPPDALIGRLGGEEFTLVCPGLTPDDAHRLAKRLRHGATRFPTVAITLSLGVASGPAADLPQLLRDADSALYAAKRAGRNRVHVAGTVALRLLP